jgi:hypothetical protein
MIVVPPATINAILLYNGSCTWWMPYETKVDHESFNWLGTDHLIHVTQRE